jgi:cell division protein YceG involved in septum cleavage
MKYLSIHKIKAILVLVFCFIFFFALSESQPKEVIFIPYANDSDTFIQTLEQRGINVNYFSKLFIQVVLALRGGVEPGGYEFSSAMGAVSTILALDEPRYKYVSIFDGSRKGEIAEKLGKQLKWDQKKIEAFAYVAPVCPIEAQEGFLAGGTYLIHVEENEERVKETMMQTFKDVLKELNIE